MYRKYYSYNDMPTVRPAPLEKAGTPAAPPAPAPPSEQVPALGERTAEKRADTGGILGGAATDDIILGAIIFALLNDGCDDKLLLLALAFVFLSGR